MLETKPLLSIVIATKNRVKYCINCIETILNFTENNFELVIQDNTDNHELKEYIKLNICDKRLIYNYNPPPFSSIDNFNAAIELARGEYVCLIGDDDGICSQIFEVVSWARKNHIESICPKKVCEYFWPDSLGNLEDSKLFIPKSSGQIQSIDPSVKLFKFFRKGALDYLSQGFPKIYHGIVKKECLDRVKLKTGCFFGGLSPDIYSAISLACTVKSHIIIDFPLTIAGSCKQSATIASIKGQHSGKLNTAPHFRDHKNYVWDNLIPQIYSVETMWAESALKAVKDMGRNDLRLLFNINIFLIKNILRNVDKFKFFTTETLKYLKYNKKGVVTIFKLISLLIYFIFKYVLNMNFLHKKNNSESSEFTNVLNIGAATLIVTKILKHREIILKF